MKLVTFEADGRIGIGRLVDDDVIDFAADPTLPDDMTSFVALGRDGLDRAAALDDQARLPRASVRLLAPLRPPNNVMCVGKNYSEHAHEFANSGFDASQEQAVPDHPVIFTKSLSSVVGPGVPVTVSRDETGTSDYEGELGVVIGTGGLDIDAADAFQHVYGYVVVNDMTIRELQKRHVQFFIGKSAATYCPIGPCLVTADEIPDITAARVRTWVNGELRQDAPVSDLIFDIPRLIATISATVRLEAGDLIATGTPAGVGLSFTPPRFLSAGDEVIVTIDGVGTLTNPMV
jgi:2-keto-4-pentenoate hydratase/2-oxohepta-3-ene-1,7-dioic acid hydratase in catechol pathway